MIRLLFVSLLAGLWQSLEVVQCRYTPTNMNESRCYNTSSGNTCFTTFLANISHPVLKPFKEASDWCKVHDPGSSLIVINSLESQRTVEVFLGSVVVTNETIVIDARKLSSSDGLKWSWVNGHHTVSTDVTQNATEFHDGACVESKPGQTVTFCSGGDWTLHRFICEYSESISNHSYRQNNKSYVASEVGATWYDARNECLRLGGDLTSIVELQTIQDWSWLKENEKYWIGLHRNKWIWNSTGDAITYTNWNGGYSDNSNNKQCVCINPTCRSETNGTNCERTRKWLTCNCNNSYAIVCQRADKAAGDVSREIDSTQSTTQKSRNPTHVSASHTTVFSPSSAGLYMTIIIPIILIVVVIFVIVAVIFAIRKCKHDKGNGTSPMEHIKQDKTVTSVYSNVVPGKRPSEDTAPSGNAIYAEVDNMTQRPTSSNNTIYASVQHTSEAVDMGNGVVYADLNLPRK